MIKRILIIIAFLFGTTHIIIACSCAREKAFCETQQGWSTHFVFTGKIVASSDSMITIAAIDILRGYEPRDTFNIWNMPNYGGFCTDSLMSLAKSLGNIGDSILIVAKRIASYPSKPYAVGDFMRPDYLCRHPSLKIKNDSIRGKLENNGLFPTPVVRSYSDFLNYYSPSGNGINCSSTVGLEKNDIKTIRIFPNPTKNNFNFEYSEQQVLNFELYSILGKKVAFKINKNNNSYEFSIGDLPKGIYFLNVVGTSERTTFKVVKK